MCCKVLSNSSNPSGAGSAAGAPKSSAPGGGRRRPSFWDRLLGWFYCFYVSVRSVSGFLFFFDFVEWFWCFLDGFSWVLDGFSMVFHCLGCFLGGVF